MPRRHSAVGVRSKSDRARPRSVPGAKNGPVRDVRNAGVFSTDDFGVLADHHGDRQTFVWRECAVFPIVQRRISDNLRKITGTRFRSTDRLGDPINLPVLSYESRRIFWTPLLLLVLARAGRGLSMVGVTVSFGGDGASSSPCSPRHASRGADHRVEAPLHVKVGGRP
jgi:hypothetical protein